MEESSRINPSHSAAPLVALWCVGVLLIVSIGILFLNYFSPITIGTLESGLNPPQSIKNPSLAGLPRRLIIPSLNIDTAVEHVGLNHNGNLKVPSTYHTVAWYEKGAAPGSMGTAVIVGHKDNGLGLDAVFGKLNKITVGSEIQVLDNNARCHILQIHE